jgi:antitoxin ParD1/3/4
MGLTSLNISLPQSLRDYVEDQVRDSGYSTPSEYVRSLLREDQKRRSQEKLEALLLEGLESGKPIEITPEYWEGKRRQLVQRHNRKKTGHGA